LEKKKLADFCTISFLGAISAQNSKNTFLIRAPSAVKDLELKKGRRI
jgi:hypothetical protein